MLAPLPAAGLRVRAVPAAVERALSQLDDRLGEQLDALGPLGTAWQRARHGLDDLLSAMDPITGDRAVAWGVDRSAPITLEWAAGPGGRLAKALLARLDGRGGAAAGAVVWHARVRFGLVEPAALQARLAQLAQRMGWTSPATRWVLRGVRWQAVDGEGLWIGLRVAGGQAALDLVQQHGSATREGVAVALERAQPPVPPTPAPEGVEIVLQPAGLGAVEAAKAAAVGLSQPPGEKQAAVAEVLSLCVGAWTSLAGLAPVVDHHLLVDARGLVWRASATLSPAGDQAWSRAQAPLPLSAGGPEPAGYQVGLAGGPFPDPGLAVLARCPGIPEPVRALAVLAAAPAVLTLAPPPLLAPPGGWGAGARPRAQAALVLGAGGSVAAPHLGAVATGARLPEQPLGVHGVAFDDPGGRRWVLDGQGLAVSAAQRAVGGRPVAVFGIGPDAALRLTRRLRRSGDAQPSFLEAWVRPGALADALVGAGLGGAEVQALRAVAARLGPLRLEGQRQGGRLAFEARWGELDHPPGGK